MDLKETECYNMGGTHLAQDGAHWQALGKMEINILRIRRVVWRMIINILEGSSDFIMRPSTRL
jgi:hypothetical protein